jgi:formamidopyrimidine-DNA glycosylase
MPELPEVEVVRRGLAEHTVGRVIESVEVNHPRAVRRHLAGPADLAARLTGRRVGAVCRRGKYLWLTFDEPDGVAVGADALVVHLGMSGQMLVQPPESPVPKHAHIVAALSAAVVADTAGGVHLRFVDQRTFGGWALAPLVEVDGMLVPEPVAHIALDPLDPRFDVESVIRVLRGKHTEIKRALLDQAVVSGIGNIYADESLWRARIHPARRTDALPRPALRTLFACAHDVMTDALAAGGTSFDALYVNVNGSSGYFDRSLAAYGREGEPCARCGAPIRRESFMNRSSYYCPRCQPRPRAPAR